MPDCINIDFHIHSCHSACGNLDMSPKNVINTLKQKNIKIAAISDHNSMKNSFSFIKYGEKEHICIFPAMEIQTEEEIHTVVVFPDIVVAQNWQKWVDGIIPKIKLNPEVFGDEPVVDEDENIIELPEFLYTVSLPISFENLEEKAYNQNLIYFPAHINDSSYSIISQLGFIPEKHLFNVVEISKKQDYETLSKVYPNITFITNSDAHYLNQIGLRYNCIISEKLKFLFDQIIKNNFDKDKKAIIYDFLQKIFYKKADEEEFLLKMIFN